MIRLASAAPGICQQQRRRPFILDHLITGLDGEFCIWASKHGADTRFQHRARNPVPVSVLAAILW